MTIIRFLVFFFLISSFVRGQKNVATALGYPADAKLLIIHADDLGVTHSENEASIKAMEDGSVTSASVMMPTPWVLEVADYVKTNPQSHDLGLHLVLTSEWKNYKWGPVSSINTVPSLTGEYGYFYDNCSPEVNVVEVEAELRAQIERAYSMGLEPTHIDSHMGCLFQTPELIEVYLKMSLEYQLPAMVTNEFPADLLAKYKVKAVVDNIIMIEPDQYANGSEAFYINAMKNLKPGLSIILLHAGYDNDELKAMAADHPEYGNEWRQKDFDFFTSDICKETLKQNQIQLVTWRQVKEAFFVGE